MAAVSSKIWEELHPRIKRNFLKPPQVVKILALEYDIHISRQAVFYHFQNYGIDS